MQSQGSPSLTLLMLFRVSAAPDRFRIEVQAGEVSPPPGFDSERSDLPEVRRLAIMQRLTEFSPDNAIWRRDVDIFNAKIAALDGR